MKGGISAGSRMMRLLTMMSVGTALFGLDRDQTERVLSDPFGKRRPQRDRIVNRYNQEVRREERRKIYKVRSAYQEAVNALTNWERNQWARAGYPGQKSDSVAEVERYNGRVAGAKIMALRGRF